MATEVRYIAAAVAAVIMVAVPAGMAAVAADRHLPTQL